MHFCTGPDEQKARNLEHSDQIAITTGTNTWAEGLDVVVEGRAARISDDATLQRLADAWEAKYGSFWHFDVVDGMFGGGPNLAAVFRVEAVQGHRLREGTARPDDVSLSGGGDTVSPGRAWTTTRSSFSANPSPRS